VIEKLVVMSIALVGIVLTGCGLSRLTPPVTSSPPIARAVITGIATPCHPQLSTTAELARLPVTVTLQENGGTIATQIVTGRHVFRFVIAPGTYSVVSSAAGTSRPLESVHAGQLVRVDLFSDCI